MKSLGVISFNHKMAWVADSIFKSILTIILLICFSICGAESGKSPFEVRGTLPWHNFLSGPSAWNENDYIEYLDKLKSLGLNMIAFHCYTGGGERYVTYVEPIIRIEYRNVVPECAFDTSLTARWGYSPLPVSKFGFGTSALFPKTAVDAFGADCALLARDKEERYAHAQGVMRKVISLAHARGIQVGIGFEFGIHPPEFASIVSPSSWIRGVMLPDPTHPASIEILRKTIDNILEAYPDIDWIWLWLHEFSMDVTRPYASQQFREIYQRDWQYFQDAPSEEAVFTGVWALTYIRQAHSYLAKKAPKVKLAISGWGNRNQLPAVLMGLDRALPLDIVFACLNPDQGAIPQLPIMEEIAKRRKVWAIPWLEGDRSLWHLQPRVSLMREHVMLAHKQNLNGLFAIHWRTEEIKANLEAFALYAKDPVKPPTVEQFYKEFCKREYGAEVADKIAEKLVWMDINQEPAVYSPEYYPYEPHWGVLKPEQRQKFESIFTEIKQLRQKVNDTNHLANLDWLLANLEFTLLLDETSRAIEPAWRLRDAYLRDRVDKEKFKEQLEEARKSFNNAPIEKLFKTFEKRIRSRGELGVLSSVNQKLYVQYLEIKKFLEKGSID